MEGFSRRQPFWRKFPCHDHFSEGSQRDGGGVEGEKESHVKEEPGDKSARELAEGEGDGQQNQEEDETPQVPLHRYLLPSSGTTGTGILCSMSRITRSI